MADGGADSAATAMMARDSGSQFVRVCASVAGCRCEGEDCGIWSGGHDSSFVFAGARLQGIVARRARAAGQSVARASGNRRAGMTASAWKPPGAPGSERAGDGGETIGLDIF